MSEIVNNGSGAMSDNDFENHTDVRMMYQRRDELQAENARLKELNREMVNVLKLVCSEICDEQHREACPDGYSSNCYVLKVLAKAEGVQGE